MRSKFEYRVAKELDRLKVKYKYEAYTYQYEVPINMREAYCATCKQSDLLVVRRYTPDFFLANGNIIEAKGKWTSQDRQKMLTVRDTYPKENFHMLFMYDNKISKSSKTRYSTFCKKNGLEYAVFSRDGIPKEWYV